MTEANIRDLRPTTRNRILEAKVYRSWIGRNPPNITEKSYHAILLDKQVSLQKYCKQINLTFHLKLIINKHFYVNRVMQYKQTLKRLKKKCLPPILYQAELIESQDLHAFLQ